MRAGIVALGLLVFWGALGTQHLGEQTPASSVEPRVLAPTSSVPLQLPSFGGFVVGRCDGAGNLYYDVPLDIAGPTLHAINSRILKIDVQSGEPSEYRLPLDLAQREAYSLFQAFSVTPRGDVWLLVNGDRGYHAIELDGHGGARGQMTLQTPAQLEAYQFAVSNDGTSFVGGRMWRHRPASREEYSHGSHAFDAIFKPSGEVLAQIAGDLPSEGDARRDAEAGLTAEDAVWGGDGNLYIARPYEILVVSAIGNVEERIPYDLPGGKPAQIQLAVSGGWISIGTFVPTKRPGNKPGPARTQYLVIDATTGRTIGLYVPSPEFGLAACFSRRDGFTGLKFDRGKVYMTKAPLG